jgi:uncharacterized protein (TIGR03435 family)
MKKISLLLVLLLNYAFAQTKNETTDLEFKTILNSPVKQIKLSDLKGKIVLIDFWATWCGSCLEAMPHLKALQQQYKNELQVITVTDETAKRAGQYLSARPSNLWFAIDTDGTIAKLFPHRMIPHTVLLSTDGKVVANTNPEAVTPAVIDSLWHKKEVHLPQKKDNLLGTEEILDTYFFAADTVKTKFVMQDEIKGGPGMSTTYQTAPAFNGRRITCVNLPLSTLYMIAYGPFPYGRVINQTAQTDDRQRNYCLDLIVADKKDLMPTLQKELSERFDLQARVEQQVKDVYVLKVADPVKTKTIPVHTSGARTYFSRHGEIDQQGITMADFAGYLENYGSVRLPVLDETLLQDKFDIKFSFQPENPASLTQILNDMGLRLEKVRRKIKMLVLYKL